MLFVVVLLFAVGDHRQATTTQYEAYYADKEACLQATSRVAEELNERDRLYVTYTCTPKNGGL